MARTTRARRSWALGRWRAGAAAACGWRWSTVTRPATCWSGRDAARADQAANRDAQRWQDPCETETAKPERVEATCEARTLTAPRGNGGFGYDPLFLSTELGVTFAEAALPAKQRVSHRGRAIRALIEVLVRRSQ